MLFNLLTAQRPGNVIKATWDEIDLKMLYGLLKLKK